MSARREVRSACCYCGVGCGVVITAEGNRITGVRGDPLHPANFGRLCTKGSTLHLTAGFTGRALYPELRHSRSLPRERVSWDQALDYAARRFAGIIRQHGPDAVAFYVSGQLLTEDYYVFNKLAKGLVGTNNIDTNSRLCMSSAVAGYKATLGADCVPACYEDIDWASCILIAGSNTAYAHPVLFRRIEEARVRNPGLKLIVVDPRRTDTAASADLHLPLLPGTDVALFNGMLHVLLWEGLVNWDFVRRHTTGFEALKEAVREYTPKAVAQVCGVDEGAVIQAAKWFGSASASLSLYCQGLNQSVHGTDKNAALINLHLAAGQIGRPGAGPLSLTGQPNAMGGREVGAMANLLSAHRDLANPRHREEVARFWGVDAIPEKPGKTAVELFDALATGEIKAVWIACTNPAQSLPDQARVREALQKVELVVVEEAYRSTETAEFADLLLPAATWGEKEGTQTNSERRITRVRAAVPPPGEARADWEIACDFARRLGRELGRNGDKLFPYRSPEEIFNEHRETTRGRDLDITGLTYRLLERKGPQQWPFPEGARQAKARLFEEGVFATPDGRARFVVVRYAPVAEETSARYPLHLITGRLRDQWHSMARTGTVARLYNHVEEPAIALNPEDMVRRGLKDGDIVRVRSRRGELLLKACSSRELREGQAFIPMHWGSRFMAGNGCNALTLPVCDPVSRQPELKHAAVQVEKHSLPFGLVAFARGEALARMYAVQPLLKRFACASVGLAGRDHPLVVVRAFSEAPIEPALIDELDRLLGLNSPWAMTYQDISRGVSKRVLVERGEIVGVRLAGETAAQDWLKDAMAKGLPAQLVQRWTLAPLATPPLGAMGRGRIVCNCMDVSEAEIREAVQAGADLAALQEGLQCGTQCGSCLPEVRRMVAISSNPVLRQLAAAVGERRGVRS